MSFGGFWPECSDGSVIFRFGDVRETERVDVEMEELEGTGDDVDQVASTSFSGEDGKIVNLQGVLDKEPKEEVADSNFNHTTKEKAESHSVAECRGDLAELVLTRRDYPVMAEVVSFESPESIGTMSRDAVSNVAISDSSGSALACVVSISSEEELMETIEGEPPSSIGLSELTDAVNMETIGISENGLDASLTTDLKSHPTKDMENASHVEEILKLGTKDEDIAPASSKADSIVELPSGSPSEESIQEIVQTDGTSVPDTATAKEKVDVSIKGSRDEDSVRIETILASSSSEVESLVNEKVGNVATSIAPDVHKSESLEEVSLFLESSIQRIFSLIELLQYIQSPA